jgi:hypothetical protein
MSSGKGSDLVYGANASILSIYFIEIMGELVNPIGCSRVIFCYSGCSPQHSET